MKLSINKKKLKTLSSDKNILSKKLTPNVAGGVLEPDTDRCKTDPYFCGDYTRMCTQYCNTQDC
ncbi:MULTISPECIES: hypothetical protein [Pseudoalteromonas]|uniref:Uncharacterized protein n=1 Tax=Pseudoalteromonas amylolytica TaxID=1859457 RepID=A0A1S1MTN2_9GAMM|nr:MULTISPECIES: hypothetical protein [Pseudoalteromonas]OHU84971.1 hypothetical protein BFC16_19985 [Pseudoalteromonas sp. JW3]OHU90078.1 hypothetical protein BET10_14990 [Pseudoalteromonas amylolytica]